MENSPAGGGSGGVLDGGKGGKGGGVWRLALPRVSSPRNRTPKGTGTELPSKNAKSLHQTKLSVLGGGWRSSLTMAGERKERHECAG